VGYFYCLRGGVFAIAVRCPEKAERGRGRSCIVESRFDVPVHFILRVPGRLEALSREQQQPDHQNLPLP
jgi:hypothetical protein